MPATPTDALLDAIRNAATRATRELRNVAAVAERTEQSYLAGHAASAVALTDAYIDAHQATAEVRALRTAASAAGIPVDLVQAAAHAGASVA